MLWAIEFAVKNWRTITVIILLAGTFVAGWYNGSDSVKRDWEMDIHLRVKEQLAAAEKSQKLIVALQEKEHANLKRIDTLAANNHALWLRLPKTPCDGIIPTSGSETTTAGNGELLTQAEQALKRFTDGLADEAKRADQIVEQCRVVVEWAASPH